MAVLASDDPLPMGIHELLGIELPIIQAPMVGVQGSALAIAVSNAGGLGSLPCAMPSPDAMHAELTAITGATRKPFNVNFFCHTPPVPDPEREAAWRDLLRPITGSSTLISAACLRDRVARRSRTNTSTC